MAEPDAATAGGARRWRLLVTLPLVVVLGLLLADRLLVGVVEHRLSARLSCLGALTGTRSVHIGGFPFLTQVAEGHYRVVTVTADGVGASSRLTDVDVTFHDVRMPPLAGLVGQPAPGSVSVGSVSVEATVTLGSAGLAASLGAGGGLLDAAGSGQLDDPIVRLGGLPFPVHIKGVQPVPGGVRVALSVPGTAVSGGAVGCQG
ncbi:DUF2993 domain-containing protein [Frankia sp. AgB1.9]|uniref:LmeA family phospholipid-binding protein n=1 Tax=unclassified Frankia TaxID=2632575 RepID=UPI001932CB56|nr:MULTISPECIES: DUF2993 domain-containing protein [unclassified Frankia]MBL7491450.1 DUF2993 domain-containing protein [Frankia sp. AgW1.1]MBL7551154.1 DUF2993 domain-containing protein [Frankia sp. AgB1.9]MBL7621859.1 DUF2993 domain-containing protein [Frankia sp. AgB1.8]